MQTLQERGERPLKLITSNRKAGFDFEIIQKIEAGLVLQGTEVKSLRAGKCNLQDSFAAFKDKHSDELVLFNLQIAEYDFGNRMNHEPKRPRKLLLHASELRKLRIAVQEKGLTLIPLQLHFSGARVKVLLGLARARKKFDKRENTKEREVKRELDRRYKTK